MSNLYTIGCSNHSVDYFLELLKMYNISAIADVRSDPYSKHTPQFNQEPLRVFLNKSNIHYLHFGNEFGARRNEPEVYTNGKVSFEKVRKLPTFINGVKRIQNGLSKGMNIALMCTEKDPIDCHRFLMVSHGIEILSGLTSDHILHTGQIESTKDVEKRMLLHLNLQPDIFNPDMEHTINKAYNIFSERIAYQENRGALHE